MPPSTKPVKRTASIPFRRDKATGVFAQQSGNRLQVNVGLLWADGDTAAVLTQVAELQKEFNVHLEAARTAFEQTPTYQEFVNLRDKLAEVATRADSERRDAEERTTAAAAAIRTGADPREAQVARDLHQAEAETLERWANELKPVVAVARSKAEEELAQVIRAAYTKARTHAREEEGAAITRLLVFSASDLAAAVFASSLHGTTMEDAIRFHAKL